MKLLVLSYWFPYPPTNGAKMRVYHLLKRLAGKHDLHLLTFSQDDEDLTHLERVQEFCRDVQVVKAKHFTPSAYSAAAGLLSIRPRSSVECYSKEMALLVRRALARTQLDAAVAFTLRMAEYITDARNLPKVLDEDNAEPAYMRRQMELQSSRLSKFRHRMTWVKARIHERRLASRFEVVTAVSEDDRQAIAQALAERARPEAIRVVPNGVDLELLSYRAKRKDHSRLVYTGALSYFANLDAVRYFCLEILPLVRQKIPNVTLTVTGSIERVDVSELAEVRGVEFTGFVPDIRPVVAEAAALVVPARLGGGTRLKVLEAMALGTPVVATSLGAMGFGAINGKHLLIADNPREFAEAVVFLMANSNLAQTLTENAREFVRHGYGWDVCAGKLDEAIRLAVETRRGSACAKMVMRQPSA